MAAAPVSGGDEDRPRRIGLRQQQAPRGLDDLGARSPVELVDGTALVRFSGVA